MNRIDLIHYPMMKPSYGFCYLLLLFGLLTMIRTASQSSSSNDTRRVRRRTDAQRGAEYERINYRFGHNRRTLHSGSVVSGLITPLFSHSSRSSTSSHSVLLERFGGRIGGSDNASGVQSSLDHSQFDSSTDRSTLPTPRRIDFATTGASSILPMSQFSFEDILNSVELVDIEIGSDSLPEFEEPKLGIDQSLELIKLGLNPYQPLQENSQAKAMQTNFLKSIFKQQPAARATRGRQLKPMFHCPICKERWLDSIQSTTRAVVGRLAQCTKCEKHMAKHDLHLLSADNLMDPWITYLHLLLPKLNEIEQMLIARIHPFMRVFRLHGGAVGYKGQILNVQQDITELTQQLPLLPSEIPCFIVRKPNQSSPIGHRDFLVNRNKIIQWLTFLKEHSEYYHDIDLDAAVERAQQLPEDGSVAGAIQSVEFEKDLPLSQGQQNDDNDRRPSPAVVSLPRNGATREAHGVLNEDEPIPGEQLLGPETGKYNMYTCYYS